MTFGSLGRPGKILKLKQEIQELKWKLEDSQSQHAYTLNQLNFERQNLKESESDLSSLINSMNIAEDIERQVYLVFVSNGIEHVFESEIAATDFIFEQITRQEDGEQNYWLGLLSENDQVVLDSIKEKPKQLFVEYYNKLCAEKDRWSIKKYEVRSQVKRNKNV